MFGEMYCMYIVCKNKIEIVWNYGKMFNKIIIKIGIFGIVFEVL